MKFIPTYPMESKYQQTHSKNIHRIPVEELLNKLDFDYTNQNSINKEEFLNNEISAIEINGINVIFVDQDHTDNPLWENGLPIFIQSMLTSSSINAVVCEYFPKEVESNIKDSPLYKFPLTKQILKGLWNHTISKSSRIQYYNKVTEICKNEQKDIYVFDIANKPAFQRKVVKTMKSHLLLQE